jgi:hypothetical protein
MGTYKVQLANTVEEAIAIIKDYVKATPGKTRRAASSAEAEG